MPEEFEGDLAGAVFWAPISAAPASATSTSPTRRSAMPGSSTSTVNEEWSFVQTRPDHSKGGLDVRPCRWFLAPAGGMI
jgi:hypothetical protein